mgnify:FL=1
MKTHRVIFPAFLLGTLMILLVIRLIANPSRTVNASPLPANTPASSTIGEENPTEIIIPEISSEIQPNGGCSVSSAYPDSILQWCDLITLYADENGLDPNLLAAVMLQESGGNPDAYSHSGAVGLMQIMPRDGIAASFQCGNRPCFSNRPSMDELFNPDFNISYGARMLAGLVARRGNIREALFAYGPMDVGYYYADLVLNIFNSYQ